MKSEILYPGAFPMVRVELAEGEHIKAESGAMVACSPTIDIESKMEGGFLGALSRKFLTGEKFFFQTLRASRGSGEALLAPTVPGEIVVLELDGVNEYLVQKDGFLAGADGITIDSQMQSMTRGLLGGEGFFILKMSGKGMLVLNSFGAIHRIELKPDQDYIVDNSHLVAWSATTTYNIEKATSGWVASFTSGEGFVCRFRGPGVVYIQSRNPRGFRRMGQAIHSNLRIADAQSAYVITLPTQSRQDAPVLKLRSRFEAILSVPQTRKEPSRQFRARE